MFKYKKSFYGILQSTLIFYRNMAKDLDAYGSQMNPYNPCMANKIINNKHMTVLWHVNVLKVSHVDSFEVTMFAGYMSSIYGGIIVHRVKVHQYLVIGLDYRKKITVKLSMIEYLDSVLQEFPK